MAYTSNDSGFQRALARFKDHLSPAEREKFSVTSVKDVQETIVQIQNVQASQRRMMNLTRVSAFVEAMEQYGKVVEVFLNVSEIIAFIWGPIKFLLQVASTWVESFDALLGAYEEISEHLPQLLEYGELFKRHAHMRKILELMYGDILEFHRRALKFFSRPTWKQLFHSSWKTFRTHFQCILSSLSRHKNLVESQANLVEYEQSQAARLEVQNSFEVIAKAERSRRMLAVNEKIRPPSSFTDHEAATEIRQEYPESGRWILRHPSLRDWKEGITCPLLWVNGIPGGGKTVIASLLIEEMKSIDSLNVCFFYCKYNDNHKRSFTDILRGLLVQLVHQNEDLLSYVYDACCSSSELTIDSPNRLRNLVETSVKSCPDVCIIVDGIDECEETEEKKVIMRFLALLENSGKNKAGTIRLLFISQRDKVTESMLAAASVIELGSKDHLEDIQTYARQWCMKIQHKFGISENSVQQIYTTVATQAGGLFLYAKLVLTHLYSQTTRGKLFTEIDCFPSGLDAAYERIAVRIFESPNQSERDDAHNIFRWIICAKRRLKWSDIQSIFAVDPNSQRVDFDERQLRVTWRDLCGSLVETGAGDSLELVHKSAESYLIETGRISVRSGDLYIAQFCLEYLNFGCFDADLPGPKIREYLGQGYYSFEDYAIAHWLDHVDSCTSQPLSLEGVSLELLLRRLESLLAKHWLDWPPDLSVSTDLRFQCIRQWAFTDRLDCLAHLASQKETNEKYLDLETQLRRRRLIYEDMITNTESRNGMLQEQLLFQGSGWFKCPRKHCDSFFDGFPTASTRDKHVQQHERPFRCSFESCLYTKLGYGTEQELKRHEKMSHLTSQGSEWAFPTPRSRKNLDIFSASKKGDLATVRQLIEEGTDANQKRPRGGTALLLAVKNDHPDVVRYLLDHGGDIFGNRVILEAVISARLPILQMLLEKVGDPTTKTSMAQDALRTAAAKGRGEVVASLLDCGVDINRRYSGGSTPLQVARSNGHHEFAQLLLDLGSQDEPERRPTPTPAAPVTPRHPASFGPSQADQQRTARVFGQELQERGSTDESYGMPFTSELDDPDLLEDFDFEQFITNTNYHSGS